MTQTRDLIKKMAEFFKSEEYCEKGEDARLELSPEDVRCMNRLIHTVNLVNGSSEKPNKWIPVSERLPDKYTYTLWCASSGYVRSDYFNGEFWEDAKKYCYEVVAWMPLPEPYVPDINIGKMSEIPTGEEVEE